MNVQCVGVGVCVCVCVCGGGVYCLHVHVVFVFIRNELIVVWELNLEEQGVSKVS